LFAGIKNNTKLEALSLTNVGLTDRTALMLAEAVEKNSTLRVLNVETNFISPQVVVALVKALLQNMSVEEFRASNQVSWMIAKRHSGLMDVRNDHVALSISFGNERVNIESEALNFTLKRSQVKTKRFRLLNEILRQGE
jgi:hypothetical protein